MCLPVFGLTIERKKVIESWSDNPGLGFYTWNQYISDGSLDGRILIIWVTFVGFQNKIYNVAAMKSTSNIVRVIKRSWTIYISWVYK